MRTARFARALALAALLVPAAGGARAGVSLPPYTREVLPNGVVLYLLPRHGTPLVELRAVVRGGAEADPPEKAGLAAVTADLLASGAGPRTQAQFAAAVNDLGGTFDTYVDAQSTWISLEALSENAHDAVSLLADALLRPAFPQHEVEKQIAQAIDDSRAAKDSLSTAAWQYFRSFVFGPRHPYGRPFWGDELSLPRISRADILACHARLYVGTNLIVVAAGDFPPDAMHAWLTAAFAAAPAGSPYHWLPRPARPLRAGPRLLLVDKPDATQTYFLIGLPGISRTNPDRIAVWLANGILGGNFTSLLNETLRVRSGLTYGAWSYFDQDRLPGEIAIASYTDTAHTTRALDLALAVLQRFRENGVTAGQLAAIKSYIEGSYPADNLETSDQLACVLGEMELYGLGRDEIDRLYDRIDAVTLEQVNAAIRKYFSAGALDFVLVGNAGAIRDELRRYAPVLTEVSIAEPGFTLAPGHWEVSSLPPAEQHGRAPRRGAAR